MTRDGFGTLSAGLVARGTQRARDILIDAVPVAQTAAAQAGNARRSSNGDGLGETAHLRPVRNFVTDDRRPAGADALVQNNRSEPAADLPLVTWGPGSSDDDEHVTMTVSNPRSETPAADNSPPTKRSSTTYKRRSAQRTERREVTGVAKTPPAMISTPAYSGPDRRTRSVSPKVERRQSVPPRIKTSVRLEQERYLRLKLAAQQTERTQQDLLTAALDAYLDRLKVDKFIRVTPVGILGAGLS